MPTLLDDIYFRLGGDSTTTDGSFCLQEGNGLVSFLQAPNPPSVRPGILGPGVQGAAACQHVARAVKGIVSSAESIVDIATPAPLPSGAFVDALAAGLANRTNPHAPLLVRIHATSRAFDAEALEAGAAERDVRAFLLTLTDRLPADAPIAIAVRLSPRLGACSTWQHGRVVAVDGRLVIVGGHSLNADDYIGDRAVHDLSLLLCGPAATSAHAYCDALWSSSGEGHAAQHDVVASLLWSEGRISRGTPAPRPDVWPDTAGTVRTLSVAALGASMSTHHRSASTACDLAKVAAFDAAQTSIRICQRDFSIRREPADGPAVGDEQPVLNALSRALNRGVKVSIVLAPPDPDAAPDGSVTGDGWRGAASAKEALVNWLTRDEGLTLQRFAFMLSHLQVAETDATPAAANHAKVYVVDDAVAYVGADGIDMGGGMQYGMLIEEPEALEALLATFWEPLWANATVVS